MKRVPVYLGDEQSAALDRLSEELAVTKTTAIRNGISLLRAAIRASRAGNRIAVVNNSGSVVAELVGVWDEAEPARATA